MEFQPIRIEERANLFAHMVLSCQPLYYTVFTDAHERLYCTAPDDFPIDLLFGESIDWSKNNVLEDELHRPVWLLGDLDLSWIIVPIPADHAAHVLGPFFLSGYSRTKIEQKLASHNFSIPMKRRILATLQQIPVIASGRAIEYTLMLYYVLYEETLDPDRIVYLGEATIENTSTDDGKQITEHGTYETEKEVLRMVSEGDLGYREHMKRLALAGSIGKLSDDAHPDRQVKNSMIVAITLFCRAAMDGGLNPEIAYSLSDYYLQAVESTDDFAELAELINTMQDDYVRRVHELRKRTGLSKPVSDCIEYLEYHLEQKIDFPALAASLGYDDDYFSRKFKSETGLSPHEYLMEKRFDRAKFLLRSTNQSVKEISARLQFCSQSHFTKQFRQRFDITPAAYRNAPS